MFVVSPYTLCWTDLTKRFVNAVKILHYWMSTAQLGPSIVLLLLLCRQLQGSKSTRRNAAKDIAAASVVAAAGIYDSMNTAASTVFFAGGESTSKFIGHRCACPIFCVVNFPNFVFHAWGLQANSDHAVLFDG